MVTPNSGGEMVTPNSGGEMATPNHNITLQVSDNKESAKSYDNLLLSALNIGGRVEVFVMETCCVLEDSGFESQLIHDFLPSSSVLSPKKRTVLQWVPCLFIEVKAPGAWH
jgi:hypothetical protein